MKSLIEKKMEVVVEEDDKDDEMMYPEYDEEKDREFQCLLDIMSGSKTLELNLD